MSKSMPVTPITIGGIQITQNLIESLNNLKDLRPDATQFFTEQCLIISTIDLEHYGLDRELFTMFLGFYHVIRALHDETKGGSDGVN